MAAALAPVCQINCVHGDTDKSVIGKISVLLKSESKEGQLLFITHAAFFAMRESISPEGWHLIWDELPQIDQMAEENVSKTHSILTNWIDVVEVENASGKKSAFGLVVAKNPTQIAAIAKNEPDDKGWDIFKGMAQKIRSSHWNCYVNLAQFNDFLAERKRQQLQIFSILQPSIFDGFASVTMMGACFKESIVYQLWSQMGVEFIPNSSIQRNLRYQQHQNGALLTIRYAAEEQWSKAFRNRAAGVGAELTVLSRITSEIRRSMADLPFVWMANKDIGDNLFGGLGARLPNAPHGMNNFQDYHHTVVVSALNPKTAHFKFLESMGVEGQTVRQWHYWQQVYQAAMRTSLRNPADMNPKTVTVMDSDTADWLAAMFPGSVVEQMNVQVLPVRGKAGRPRKHANDNARLQAHRSRLKIELLEELQRHTENYPIEGTVAGTIFRSIQSTGADCTVNYKGVEDFISQLRRWNASTVRSKQSVRLISPASFDASLSNRTNRGLENVVSTWGVWLDNDGADLSHGQFASIFPNLRIVVFNSFNTRADNPRYRVFIPTTTTMSGNAYRIIVEQILKKVNAKGFWSAEQLAKKARIKSRLLHGFDMSKIGPASLFFLPSQAGARECSFFCDYNEQGRLPLNPYDWAAETDEQSLAAPMVPILPEPAKPLSQAQQAKCDAAIAEWRTSKSHPGTGNQAFFKLGVRLRANGMGLPDIQATLISEAAYARTPSERYGEVTRIINMLSNPPSRVAA